MYITRRTIHRRTMLRGIGAALALPILDSMVPALTAQNRTAARPFNRFGAVYVPNGVIMGVWTPATEGAGFELMPAMKPLMPFHDQLIVVSGLSSVPPPIRPGDGAGVHARASTRFLTDVPPKSTEGADLEAGISMDQIAAKELGQHTQFASLEMGIESTESAGACDGGFACPYTSTISWRSSTTPLPMENDPRAVFERLFGDDGSSDPKARLARIRQDRSVLDSVISEAGRLQAALGHGDRAKLDEYLEAIRDVERRIQKAEEQAGQQVTLIDHPAGIPASFDDHMKVMFDLQVLAYQTDLTRVTTFMVGREFSGMTYPQIGVPDAHHPISHHRNEPERIEKVARINTYHVTLFAYLLDKLRSTADGDGSLLDHVTILYGAGMSDSNAHNPHDLPIVLVGGGAGQLKGGRHVRVPKDTPLANLHLTLLDKFGVRWDRMGDSTGRLDDRVLAGV